MINPADPASLDVIINPSVLQSGVSVRWSEDRCPEETSHDARVEVGVSERKQVPLPPPSVVLELLRNRQHRAAHAEVNALQTPARTEMGADPAREHVRRHSKTIAFVANWEIDLNETFWIKKKIRIYNKPLLVFAASFCFHRK